MTSTFTCITLPSFTQLNGSVSFLCPEFEPIRHDFCPWTPICTVSVYGLDVHPEDCQDMLLPSGYDWGLNCTLPNMTLALRLSRDYAGCDECDQSFAILQLA
jgi:hypothetical protein